MVLCELTNIMLYTFQLFYLLCQVIYHSLCHSLQHTHTQHNTAEVVHIIEVLTYQFSSFGCGDLQQPIVSILSGNEIYIQVCVCVLCVCSLLV